MNDPNEIVRFEYFDKLSASIETKLFIQRMFKAGDFSDQID